MARKPANFEWLGFSEEQIRLLDLLDHLGNNGWSRNGQTDALMPGFILKLDKAIGLERVKRCMADIGYRSDNLHMLDRWHAKATTGKFGR
jgi:hypothetical protein